MAHGQSAPRRQIAVAISGGASLGAYEGGFLYSLVEDIRRLSAFVELRGFSGTSAGAINAFVSTLQACSAPPRSPEASAFYRTWMPIGFDALFDRDAVKPVAALSRSALEGPVLELEKDFKDGLDEACDILLGVTATRVKPLVVNRADGRLRLPRMAAQFLFRVDGHGTGRPPSITNHVGTPDRALPQLPVDGDEADAFRALLPLVLASSAFPFAFEPVSVPHCPGRLGQKRCRPDDARSSLFLDGGIFDQNPINVGIEEFIGGSRTSSTAARLYLLDPFQRTYPKVATSSADDAIEDALGYGALVAAGFVNTARSQGLETLLRADPSLEQRIVVAASKYPPYGELAFYFLSFFEEGFRRFDFILGMIESQRALKRVQTRAILMGDHKAAAAFERAYTENEAQPWPAYRCVDAILGDGPDADVNEACGGEEAALVPLARVSRERVYDACRPDRLEDLDPIDVTRAAQHPDCTRAFEGRAPPGADADWSRRDDENELQWVFRRLEAHGYRFVDLGPTTRADRAFDNLRSLVLRCASDFAYAQGGLPGLPRALARAAVNQMGYRPPRRIIHVGVGLTQEIGFSQAVTPSAWLRVTGTLGLTGLGTILSAAEDYVGVSAQLGLEAEIPPLSGPALQVRTGVRGGWVFGSLDGGGFGTCDDPGNSVRPCSRPIVETTVSLHVIDFFRIALTGQIAPAFRADEKTLFEVRPSLGAQFTID